MCQLHDNGILLRPIDKWSKQVKCAIKWMFKLWRLECASKSAGPSVKPFKRNACMTRLDIMCLCAHDIALWPSFTTLYIVNSIFYVHINSHVCRANARALWAHQTMLTIYCRTNMEYIIVKIVTIFNETITRSSMNRALFRKVIEKLRSRHFHTHTFGFWGKTINLHFVCVRVFWLTSVVVNKWYRWQKRPIPKIISASIRWILCNLLRLIGYSSESFQLILWLVVSFWHLGRIAC